MISAETGTIRGVTALIAVALAAGLTMPAGTSAAQNLGHAKAAGIAKLKKQAQQKTKKAVEEAFQVPAHRA